MARPKTEQIPVKPTVQKTEITRATPQTKQYVAPQGDSVAVRNKKNGNIITLNRKQAQRFATQYPNEFQIL